MFPIIYVPRTRLTQGTHRSTAIGRNGKDLPLHFFFREKGFTFRYFPSRPKGVLPWVRPFRRTIRVGRVFPTPFPGLIFTPTPSLPRLPYDLPWFGRERRIAIFFLPLHINLIHFLDNVHETFAKVRSTRTNCGRRRFQRNLFVLYLRRRTNRPQIGKRPHRLSTCKHRLPNFIRDTSLPWNTMAFHRRFK